MNSKSKRNKDEIVKDKHGFKDGSAVSLHYTFTLKEVLFRDKWPPEPKYHQAALQNSKLWLFSSHKKLLQKLELDDQGAPVQDEKKGIKSENVVDDPEYLTKTKIHRMIVDETGTHCFLLNDKAVFYNHWKSQDKIFRFDFTSE